MEQHMTRRRMLGALAAAGAGLVTTAAWPAESPGAPQITACEELMRQHAMLQRVLLIYEALRRGEFAMPGAAEMLGATAGLVHTYVEDYHEKLEEDYVFTRLLTAGQQAALIRTLLDQHMAGRRLTAQLREAATRGLGDPERLGLLVVEFMRMYRPHGVWEDTVVFPQFQALLSPAEYADLGGKFQEIQRQTFGRDGFAQVLGQVEDLEQRLGINDLASFTVG
jgi:hemerythrin-like domain-containing protein